SRNNPVCKPGPTCCAESGEEKLPILAQQMLSALLTNVSRSLVEDLKIAKDDIQHMVTNTVTTAEKGTVSLLQQYFPDHGPACEAATKQLFAEVLRELSVSSSAPLSTDALSAAVGNFFDDVFPIVYYKIDASRELSPGYRECLRRERRQLAPFGAIPDLQAKVVAEAAVAIRALAAAVDVLLEAVVAASAGTGKGRGCEVAVARLTSCQVCAGFEPWSGQNKACGDFCMNVFRGCLAPWTALESSWIRVADGFASFAEAASSSERASAFSTSDALFASSSSALADSSSSAAVSTALAKSRQAEEMDKEVRAARIDPQAALKDFDLKVAKALHLAIQQGLVLGEQVSAKCGKGQSKKRRRRRAEVWTAAGDSPVLPIIREKRLAGENRLVDRLETLATMLSKRRAFFSTLGDEVCDELAVRKSDDNCWNGVEIGRYTSPVVDIGPIAQKSNPEFDSSLPSPAEDVVANLSARMDKAANEISRSRYLKLSLSSSSTSLQTADARAFRSGPSSLPLSSSLLDQDAVSLAADARGGSGSGRLDAAGADGDPFHQLGPGVDDEDRYAWTDGDQGSGSGHPEEGGDPAERRRPQWRRASRKNTQQDDVAKKLRYEDQILIPESWDISSLENDIKKMEIQTEEVLSRVKEDKSTTSLVCEDSEEEVAIWEKRRAEHLASVKEMASVFGLVFLFTCFVFGLHLWLMPGDLRQRSIALRKLDSVAEALGRLKHGFLRMLWLEN
ncbi:unnamed protein product, partial [Notodromas monacha]